MALKFNLNAAPVLGEAGAEAVAATVEDLEALEDTSGLMALLAGG
jgi:hypothetical protein